MIRAFVFDIGNVLLPFDFNRALNRIQSRCRISLPDVIDRIEPLKVGFETGRLDRQAFLKQTIQLLEFTGAEANLICAWEEIFEENLAMTKLVRELHGHYPLYLLSNTNELHVDYMFRRHPVFHCFEDAVYSHLAGCAKPDPAIYELAARQFGITPAEAVFIDDLPANIATAQTLGWHAIQYDFRNHDAFLTTLKALGLVPV